MTRTNLYGGAARLVLILGLTTSALGACSPSSSSNTSSGQVAVPLSALPLADSGEPIAPAPTASALPAAPAVRVGRLANPQDRYAYADRAYAMNNAFGDAPPDYGFDYDGTQPWVWRSNDNAMRVAEPLPDGGDRYYYYEPGADYPYLVRDPQYTYGYDNGELVVIYDHAGHVLPDRDYDARQDYASRFFARGRQLYSNAQQRRQPVAQSNWVARRDRYAAEQQQWASYQSDDSDWRDYHQAHQQQYQDQWSGERARRENEAAVFAQTINDVLGANRDRQFAQQAQVHAQAAQQREQQGGQANFNGQGGPQGPQQPQYGGPQPQAGGPDNRSSPGAQPSNYGQGGYGQGLQSQGQYAAAPGEHHHDRDAGGAAAVNTPAAPTLAVRSPAVNPAERHVQDAGPRPDAGVANGGGLGEARHHEHDGGAPPAAAATNMPVVAEAHERDHGGGPALARGAEAPPAAQEARPHEHAAAAPAAVASAPIHQAAPAGHQVGASEPAKPKPETRIKNSYEPRAPGN